MTPSFAKAMTRQCRSRFGTYRYEHRPGDGCEVCDVERKKDPRVGRLSFTAQGGELSFVDEQGGLSVATNHDGPIRGLVS